MGQMGDDETMGGYVHTPDRKGKEVKLFKWPVNPDNGCPRDTMTFDFRSCNYLETWLIDAGGIYRLMPRMVIANAIAEWLQTKKAETPKAPLPTVCLRFDQTVAINYEAAKVLLEDLADNLPYNRQ